jgi:hypothetical protein
MKKFFGFAFLATIGYWIYRTVTGQKAEAKLWNEASDEYEFDESEEEFDLR